MIHASGLSHRFRTKQGPVDAVRGVDIDIAESELVGFLGPNGAGKTTTMRMLTTLLPPTAGEATVAGRDLRTDPFGVRRRIGYVPQSGSAGMDRRVGDELRTQGRFHGQSRAEARRKCAELLDRFDLSDLDQRPVAALSGGQRRRLDIALGLIHDPRLLFLDEPSTGLDPHSRANLWEHVRALRAGHGTTVLISTHYLDEADALCDRLLVIDHGRIVATGTPEELKQRVSGDLVVFTCADPATAATAVRAMPEATDVRTEGGEVRLRTARGDTALTALLRRLDSAGITPLSLRVERPSLDDVFLELTGHSLREASVAA
ncbi:ABC-2 type transport system ATP-binding protein [Saccharopolyspora erythraea NRRL 2338]|uniref:ABC transport system ATP-binding protein n=2 Tax=Saccharopolyspora erythraea TaxID=1836 RepID=A4F7W4_SACEN|nr:ATP-binding cassette domain-containing protein [Saccharopolyspora erythraea]EQD85147.1 ABC transporter [Saccharopolyspora erythraea D]PFG93935.1 ABC-2 type transport system ATP-binding protein [Saccharopolyspora erythraea NRRL 2338]QRK90758.1 ATP-binding cassette domain-containing protein [Saccharopolyspora erythraea]CAM00138.1 ABC transport system ATP-binding protein [Saccharopolyspora erythraea NRRL 2338]